jgi:hypothetical protein
MNFTSPEKAKYGDRIATLMHASTIILRGADRLPPTMLVVISPFQGFIP